MSEQSDPFAEIITGLGMGEWPDKIYETIPSHRVALLQERLLDRMMAIGTGENLEGTELEIHIAKLKRTFKEEFEKADVLRVGDWVKLSHAGLLMSKTVKEITE